MHSNIVQQMLILPRKWTLTPVGRGRTAIRHIDARRGRARARARRLSTRLKFIRYSRAAD